MADQQKHLDEQQPHWEEKFTANNTMFGEEPSQLAVRALKTFMKDEDLHEPCPNCGGHLRRESGCIQCTDCGWSKCGAN